VTLSCQILRRTDTRYLLSLLLPLLFAAGCSTTGPRLESASAPPKPSVSQPILKEQQTLSQADSIKQQQLQATAVEVREQAGSRPKPVSLADKKAVASETTSAAQSTRRNPTQSARTRTAGVSTIAGTLPARPAVRPTKSKPQAPLATSEKNKANPIVNVTIPDIQTVTRIGRTGVIRNKQLLEASGFTASRNFPGVLYSINDSGNSPTLYAMSESGRHLKEWSINGAKNRDWEDLASVTLNGRNYIAIADTGDNLKIRRTSRIYLIPEPEIDQFGTGLEAVRTKSYLSAAMRIDFKFEDGTRNVEAIASVGRTIYLISKEPVKTASSPDSRLYSIQIPNSQPKETLVATFLSTLPSPRKSIESRLAATFAGVNLDHITAIDIDASGHTAYLLSYREVRRVTRRPDQSWPEALSVLGRRIHFHNLGQTEALAIAGNRAVFITSEDKNAEIWAIPARVMPQQN